jgi:putative hydrolase of the HAD superfamily
MKHAYITYNNLVNYSVLFVDLDDTLYPNSSGLWGAIRERMNQFLLEELKFSPDEATEIRHTYFETYGTTLRGLQINHSVDADEYLAYVHDLPLEDYISPDPKLRDLLTSLPQEKWIFTNADADHARRVLSIRGIEDCFSGIIDVRALGFLCKPEKQAYQLALSLVNKTDPTLCVMMDDSVRNLEPAHELGFKTVLVGSAESHPAADISINNLIDLSRVFPQLWADSRPM